MPDSPQYSFHDMPREVQQLILQSRRSLGMYLGATGGFAGSIFRYEAGTVEACAKIPLAKSITPKEAATRFLRELRLQRAMYYHQFVHWPFDFDLVHDTPIAWFRFWDCDLAALIEDPRFHFEGRLAMLAYLSSSLAHCHARGLVAHQDLKPENIFVQDLKRVAHDLPDASVWRIPKLADFGSANLADECGEFGGTKAYMAPEQWRREPLGQHTSVWSLGLIAYELLTYGEHPIGQPTRPWRNRTQGVFNRWQKNRMWVRWLEEGCRPARSLGDAQLDRLVGSCLALETTQRPTITEFTLEVLSTLKKRSPQDETQASFRILHAQDIRGSDHGWPYLDQRYNSVVLAIATRFGDTSIYDRHLIKEAPAC
ncbi:serine/threonine protein kinase [Aminobacter sp. MET-1]|uniref:serine/threonine protein kinase n=1 Tax=Aminobacter sp. MET-1 TaxID=2951085 RepID=UPI00226AEB9D|nr:protein kinase [Aminobacter sp. MET-1]MCX8568389.1 protein kinase [Aminobacter sp. MET-1]